MYVNFLFSYRGRRRDGVNVHLGFCPFTKAARGQGENVALRHFRQALGAHNRHEGRQNVSTYPYIPYEIFIRARNVHAHNEL